MTVTAARKVHVVDLRVPITARQPLIISLGQGRGRVAALTVTVCAGYP